MKSLAEIIASQKFHPPIEKSLHDSEAQPPPDQNPKCQDGDENARLLGDGVLKAMDEARLDALVYPTWNNPPRLIGDLNTPHGNNSNRISPPTGFPALTVPMGFAHGTLPAGLQILGTSVERADPDQDRLRLRAGDAPSPRTRQCAATAVRLAR